MRFYIILVLLPLFGICQIPTVGLIGAWPFNGNANDISGSANHGTVVNAVLVPDRCGIPNSAYDFNGLNSYIHMLTTGPTGTLSRSVSFWVKTTNTVSSSPVAAFDYGTATGAGDAFQVVWNYCSQGVGLDVSNQALIRSNACLENGAWHHIAVVMNATASTSYSNVAYYVDGTLQTAISCNVSGVNATINTGTVYPITIGTDPYSNTRHFLGTLDDFYLYNRALSSTEVLQLYNYTTCPIPIAGQTLVCPGITTVYSISPITTASYTWTLPGGWTGSSSSNTISVTTGTNGGTISVAATSSCGSFGTNTLGVAVVSLTPLSITASNPTLCIGSTGTLTASGGMNYTWMPGGSTNTTILVSPTLATTYTLSGMGTNSCVSKITFNQNVSNSITPIVTTNSALCNGSPVMLSASGASTYTWLPAGLTGSLISVTPTVNTTYTVNALSSGGCMGSAIAQVAVPPVLSLTISASSPSACLGASIVLTANVNGGMPGYSYNWTGGLSGSTIAVAEALAGTYIYSVQVIDANACSTTGTLSLDFFQGLALNASSLSICPGTIQTLTISGANTYTWLPGNLAGPSYTVSPAVASVYTVIGTSAAGCTASTTQTVTLKPAPTFSVNTFTITCGNLGSATIMAIGTPGPFSYTWMPTSQIGSAVSGLYPGIYMITALDMGTSCYFNLQDTLSPLVPLTGTVSATPSLVCYGANNASASIALSGGSGAQSYLWTDSQGTQTVAAPVTLAAGINTVTVIDALTYCSVTHTFLVSQPPALTLTLLASTPSVCMGGNISYTALASGGTPGYTYTWTTLPAGNTFTAVESLSGVYIYSATTTDASNCMLTSTVSGKFVPNPTVSVSSPSACPFANAQLAASGAVSYSWSNGSVTNPLNVSVGTSTQYTVTGSVAGCNTSTTGMVFIKPVPTASFTSNAPLCQGDDLIMISVNSQSLYSWQGPSGFASSTASVTLYAATPAQSGLYTLTVTAPNSCTSAVTKSLTIYPTPSLSLTTGTVCQGQILHLYSNFVSGASYLWTGPAAFSSTLQNNFISNANPLMTGTYTTVITSALGCTNMATVSASVIPLPIPVITANNAFCIGSSLQLSASGGQNYVWVGPNGFNSNLQNPLISPAGSLAGGLYQLYAYTGSCSASVSQSITANPLPTFSLASNSPVCEHEDITFTVTGSAVTFTLTGPNGYMSFSSNTVISQASILQNQGTYTLSATDQNACIGHANTMVFIKPAPLLSSSDATACLGSPATLSVQGAVSYTWSGPQNFSAQTQTAYISSVSLQNSGVYTVTGSGSNSCSTTNTVLLTGSVLALPVPSFTAPAKACVNSTISLKASGGETYFWSGPQKFSSMLKEVDLAINDHAAQGIYSLSVTNKNNCVATTTLALSVFDPSQVMINSRFNNLCAPYCTEFQVKELSGAPLMSQEFKIDNTILKDSIKTYCFYEGRNYHAIVNFTDSNTCVSSASLLITAYPRPDADFEYTPDRPVAGIDKVIFYNTTKGDGLETWRWYLMQDSTFLQDKEVSAYYEYAGKYPVTLIAKNKWGCLDTVIKLVVINDEYNLYVPDAFTPNGDGLNDLFQPKGQGIANYSLEIFSRWGEQIFQTTSFYEGWDGTFKGKPCKTDIYIWKIRLTDQQRELKSLTGHVTLLHGDPKED